jgi:beta-lactamase regulating signal transducer with metallopeptidase domain
MQSTLNALADVLMRQSWQVAVVFVVVLAACFLLRNASAHWRYLLWLTVLAKCLTPPIVTIGLPVLPSQALDSTPRPSRVEPSSPTGTADFGPPVDVPRPTTRPLAQPDAAISQVPAPNVTESPRVFPLDWRQSLAFVWTLIAGLILFSIAVRMWATHRRLKKSCRPADDETHNTIAELADSLGMKRLPRIYLAGSAAQPFVWGWLRGDIYLPLQFSQSGTVEQRQAILTHELAHILRWDAAVNLIQNVLQAVFFIHPLVWWANRMIRREREKCCDEIVLSTSSATPKVYCEAIVNMLAGEFASRQSTPALAVTGSTKNIQERISIMLTPNRKFRRRPSRAAVATMSLVAGCVLPIALIVTSRADDVAPAQQPEKADSGTPKYNAEAQGRGTWQPGQVMDFRVIHAVTKEPLADVTLELQNMGPGINFDDVKTQKTDADGWSRIPLPDLPPTQVRVYPTKEGFVPLRVYWAAEPHPTMPKSIIIPMMPGKRFGGTVRNEAGEPIPDVAVTVHFWADGNGENPHIRENIDATAATDKDGRWHVDVMPAEIDNKKKLKIYVHHPDYVSDHYRRGWRDLPVSDQPVPEKLFDQTAVVIMRKGETIEGEVVDRDAQPISNAAIYDSEFYWRGKPRATTDEKGKFRVTGVRYHEDWRFAGEHYGENGNRLGLVLTVEAPGYAPELVLVEPESSPLNIQLRSGQSIHGRVVDEAGHPLEAVNVNAARWREWDYRLHRQTTTDAEGRFHLKDVPTNGVKFQVLKKGYMYVLDLPLSPSDKEHEVTLRAPVRIVGSVIDAADGKPLDKFVLIPGMDFEDGRTAFWSRSLSRTIVNKGRFEATIDQEEGAWRFRVETEGYLPGVSKIFRPYNPDKGEVTCDFKLTKAAPITGTVLGLDDQPLANADVYLATQRMNLTKRKVSSTDVPPVKTDAQGRFQFPAEVEPFCLVVVHEQGVAMTTEKEFESGGHLAIKPWTAKNETLQIIRNPAPGELVEFPVGLSGILQPSPGK